MKAVLHPETVAALPAVAHWIGYAARARAVVLETASPESGDLLAALTEENVIAQLDNLRTFPCVAAKLRTGALEIHGWVYDIANGEFRTWDAAGERWRSLRELARANGFHHRVDGVEVARA
jgi:carbonic anhydrase